MYRHYANGDLRSVHKGGVDCGLRHSHKRMSYLWPDLLSVPTSKTTKVPTASTTEGSTFSVSSQCKDIPPIVISNCAIKKWTMTLNNVCARMDAHARDWIQAQVRVRTCPRVGRVVLWENLDNVCLSCVFCVSCVWCVFVSVCLHAQAKNTFSTNS